MDVVWNYICDVMMVMQSKGVMFDWVQIGNEISNGMLWEDGKVFMNMKNYVWLVNMGYNVVKFMSIGIKIIVYLVGGDDNVLYVWNIGGLINNGVNFDMIVMFFYFLVFGWNIVVMNMVNNVKDLINCYGKEIIIFEIGMDNNQVVVGKSFVVVMKN